MKPVVGIAVMVSAVTAPVITVAGLLTAAGVGGPAALGVAVAVIAGGVGLWRMR